MTLEKTAVSPAIAQLRGDFVALLAQVNNEELLREMLRLCIIALQEEDLLEDLPPEILASLERAIAESYDESDLIPNDQVIQMTQQWLKQ